MRYANVSQPIKNKIKHSNPQNLIKLNISRVKSSPYRNNKLIWKTRKTARYLQEPKKKTKNTERLTEALEQISVCTRNNSSKITNLFFTCSSYTVERDMLV